ncbi:MAG: Multidrug resistance protein MdtA [Phycisphaerae bacterium]|nr:Multidrug resistance protein MdtA [Phycisphaerae bacterium]
MTALLLQIVPLIALLAAQHGPAAQPVVVAPVVERDIPPTLRLVGTVLPEKRCVIAVETSGVVKEVSFSEGQLVRQGATIARIDPELADLRLAEATARLASLEAKRDELEAGTRKEVLERQRATVQETEALHKKWLYERERIAELTAQGESNEKERHDTEMEFLAAERRLAAARAELDLWSNGPRAEEKARARYDVAAQVAVVNQLRRDRNKTDVLAPFDGFLVSKNTEVGEWLQAGGGFQAGGAVGEIVSIETVKVRVDVPEAAISFARSGSPASIEVEALSRSQPVTITRVIPLATPASRTFPIEIDVPNADHTLLPGMFVWANVPAGPAGKRLMVSKDAIVAHGPSKQVFVVRDAPASGPPGAAGAPPEELAPGGAGAAGPPSKMAMPLAVTTGLEVGTEVEVQAAGLKAGDLVVVRANERINGPTPVIPMPMPNGQPAGGVAARE